MTFHLRGCLVARPDPQTCLPSRRVMRVRLVHTCGDTARCPLCRKGVWCGLTEPFSGAMSMFPVFDLTFK